MIIDPWKVEESKVDPYFASVSLLNHMDSEAAGTWNSIVGENFVIDNRWGNTDPFVVSDVSTPNGTGYTHAGTNTAWNPLKSIVANEGVWDFDEEPWTIEFYIRANLPPLVGESTISVLALTEDGAASGFSNVFINSSGICILTISGLFASGNIATSSTVADGAWHHVAFCYDDVSDRVFVFNDGIKQYDEARGGYPGTPAANSFTCMGGRIGNNDFASAPSLQDVRITNGVCRYTADFTPEGRFPDVGPDIPVPDGGDEFFDDVMFLTHFDDKPATEWISIVGQNLAARTGAGTEPSVTLDLGVPNGTGYTGAGFNQWKPLGTPSVDAATWEFGTGDFTVEAWLQFTTVTSDSHSLILMAATELVGNDAIGLFIITSGGYVRWFDPNGLTLNGSTNLVNGNWYHIAYDREGTTGRIYVNGQVEGSWTDANDYSSLGSRRTFVGGYQNNLTTAWQFPGNTGDMRITHNVARYKGVAFTPEGRFPDSKEGPVDDGDPYFNNVSYMCHFDNKDVSGWVGIVGATVLQQGGSGSVPTQYTNPASPNGVGYIGSGNFNRQGVAAISTPDTAAWEFGTEDFTVEGWAFYINNSSPFAGLIFAAEALSDTGSFGLGKKVSTGAVSWIDLNGLELSGSTPMAIGVWYHICYERENGVGKLYLDGVEEASQPDTTDYTSLGTRRTCIGAYRGATATLNIMIGNNADCRVTKGVARYKGPFTPEGRFPDYPTTALGNFSILRNSSVDVIGHGNNNIVSTPAGVDSLIDDTGDNVIQVTPFDTFRLNPGNYIALIMNAPSRTSYNHVYLYNSSTFELVGDPIYTVQTDSISTEGACAGVTRIEFTVVDAFHDYELVYATRAYGTAGSTTRTASLVGSDPDEGNVPFLIFIEKQ